MVVSAAARAASMIAVAVACVVACGGGPSSAQPSTGHPQATIERRPAPTIDFDRFSTVNLGDYATYQSYGVSAAQWQTNNGIRCRIQLSGNNMPGPFGIDCWSEDSPAMPAGMNTAGVSLWGYDADDPAKDPGVTPPLHHVFSTFAHLDPAKLKDRYETHLVDFTSQAVDPASYHLLGPRQKIVVSRAELSSSPGGDPSSTVATCAVGDDGSLTCEQQGDGARYGFFLSPVADAYVW